MCAEKSGAESRDRFYSLPNHYFSFKVKRPCFHDFGSSSKYELGIIVYRRDHHCVWRKCRRAVQALQSSIFEACLTVLIVMLSPN